MKFNSESKDNRTVIDLVGDIDEEFVRGAPALVKAASTADVEFNCAEIRKISSVGVKIWMEMLREIPPTTKYSFRNCPDIFISYLNLLQDFIGRGTVLSILLPYSCSNCGNTATSNFPTIGIDAAAVTEFPKWTCTRCGRQAACETTPEDHLSFLLD